MHGFYKDCNTLIKEETRQLQNTISSAMGSAESSDLDGKIAYSSDENIAKVVYVGQNNKQELKNGERYEEDGVIPGNGEIPSYRIEVQSLATSQVNIGRFLSKNERGIEAGNMLLIST